MFCFCLCGPSNLTVAGERGVSCLVVIASLICLKVEREQIA